MTYKKTIERRLRIFFLKAMRNPREIESSTRLGLQGLGYDSIQLRDTVRPALNSVRHGFEDVLKSRVAISDLGESTKFSQLVTTIVGKSHADARRMSNYEAKMQERVRREVRLMIARAVTGADPDAIHGTDRLRDHLPEERDEAFLEALNRELQKYLLLPATDYELRGSRVTVRTVVERITENTVV